MAHVIGIAETLCIFRSSGRFFTENRVAHQDLAANYLSLHRGSVYIGCSPGNGVCLRQMDVLEKT